MDKEEVIAEIVLRELKIKEELRASIKVPILKQNIYASIVPVIAAVGIMIIMRYYEKQGNIPEWGLTSICIGLACAFGIIFNAIEVRRVTKRFNALLELLEIEKKERADRDRDAPCGAPIPHR